MQFDPDLDEISLELAQERHLTKEVFLLGIELHEALKNRTGIIQVSRCQCPEFPPT